MNQYQQKFLEDMLLKDFSVATQKAYTYVVNAFFDRSHPDKSADEVTEEDLRKYFLYLKDERKHSVAGIKAALWGFRFFLRPRCRVIGQFLI